MSRCFLAAMILFASCLTAQALDEKPGCRTELDALLALHEKIFDRLNEISGTKRVDIFSATPEEIKRNVPWSVKRPIATYKKLCEYGVDSVIPYFIRDVEYRMLCELSDVDFSRRMLESYRRDIKNTCGKAKMAWPAKGDAQPVEKVAEPEVVPAPVAAPSENAVAISTPHSGDVTGVVFAPDGRTLVSAGYDKTIKVWDTSSGRVLRTLQGHEETIKQIGITPDGQKIVSTSEDETIRIWEAKSGTLLHTLQSCAVGNVCPYIDSFAIDSKGGLITLDLFSLKRWDIDSGKLNAKLAEFSGDWGDWQGKVIALSPDDKLIALAEQKDFARIRLLDAKTGKQVKGFDNARVSNITHMAFSRDGKMLATGGEGPGDLKIWDVASGRMLQDIVVEDVKGLAFSPDGKLLASVAFLDDAVRIWDTASGKALQTIATPRPWLAVAFSPDGNLLVAGGPAGIDWRNPANGEPIAFGAPAAAQPAAEQKTSEPAKSTNQEVWVIPAPADQWITALGWGESIRSWSSSTGQVIRAYDTGGKNSGWPLHSTGRDADGRWIFGFQRGADQKLWDAQSGKLVSSFTSSDNSHSQAISPDGQSIAGAESIADISTGKTKSEMAIPQDLKAHGVAFSPDGRFLAVMVDPKSDDLDTYSFLLLDAQTGQPVATIAENTERQYGMPWRMGFSPDGRTLYGWDEIGFIGAYGVESKQKLWEQTFMSDPRLDFGGALAVSPDSKLLAVVGDDNLNVALLDAGTGKVVRRLGGNPGAGRSIAFAQDGKQVIVGNKNGTTGVWATDTGELLVTTTQSPTGEWVTVTPEGFFAASANGADLLSIVRGLQRFAIGQAYQALYRPDLVSEKLAGDPKGLVKEAAAKLDLDKVIASGAAPTVNIVSPKTGETQGQTSVMAEVEIADSGGGVGRVEWRVNGVTVGVNQAAAAAGGAPLKLQRALVLSPGTNRIEVVAYNQANLVASVPGAIEAQGPPPAEVAAKPRLIALVVGVNDYADSKLQLNLAVPDAQSLAEAFNKTGGDLYESVDVTLLKDKDVTRDGLDAAFAAIAAKIKPGDVFVFFAAGHGKTVDGRYYYVPQDAQLSDLASVVAQGIAQEQWQQWFASIPARRSVLLFDTCESGTLAADDAETKTLEQSAANGRLAQATGRTIITASGGQEEAIEGYGGHGLFTYNLLDALGKADSDGDGIIRVTELASYVYAEVTQLSEQVFQHKQVPQVRIGGADHALTKAMAVLTTSEPGIEVATQPTHKVVSATELQIQPAFGSRGIRKLDADTPLTVVTTEQGWVLVAKNGSPIGYVAQGDLAPLR
jgi:WD40 repeat protein/uncharacterized caspase-like protein